MTESLDCSQEDWDDLWVTLVTRLTWLDASGSRCHGSLVFRDGGAHLAVHEDVDDVRFVGTPFVRFRRRATL